MAGISFKRGQDEISLASYQTSRCRADDWEKEAVTIGLIGSGIQAGGKDGKGRFSGRRERGTSHWCLPRSRLSEKMNVSGLLFPLVLLASSISLPASSGRA